MRGLIGFGRSGSTTLRLEKMITSLMIIARRTPPSSEEGKSLRANLVL